MAAQLSVFNGGAWRTVSALYAYAGGAWRTITNAYRHDGTTWREFFASFTLTNPTPGGTSSDTTGINPGSSNGYITTTTAGYIQDWAGTLTAFGSPAGGTNAAGKYWKWTYVSGDLPTAGSITQNTWTAVGSGFIYMLRSGTGIRTGVVAVSFADDASGTNATTAGNWTLYSEVSAF